MISVEEGFQVFLQTPVTFILDASEIVLHISQRMTSFTSGWICFIKILYDSFHVTGDRKVFGQNVCSLLTRLEVFPMNQKLSVRTRILCSFRIWVQKFLLYSLVKSNEIIFEKPKKLVWDKIFSTHFCIYAQFRFKTRT